MVRVGLLFGLLCWTHLSFASHPGHCFAQDGRIDYTTQIQPILDDYCIACHSPASREGDVLLHDFQNLLATHEENPLFTPGDANKSLLFQVLLGQEASQMPPEDSPQLTPDAINLIRTWIEQGARGPSQTLPLAEKRIRLDLPSPATPFQPIGALAIHPATQQVWLGGFESITSPQQAPIRNLGIVGKVQRMKWSPDGTSIVLVSGLSGIGGQVSILGTNPLRTLHQWEVGNDVLYALDIDLEHHRIAVAGYDRRIYLLDADSGETIRTIQGHHGAIYDLAFHPSGKALASASGDETVKVWSIPSGERLDTLPQPEGAQFSVGFSRDGLHLFAGGADRRWRVWKFLSLDQPIINPLLHVVYAHEDPILFGALGPNHDWIASVGKEGKVKTWTFPQLHPISEVTQLPSQATSLAIQNDGAIVIAETSGQWKVWPLPQPSHSSASVPSPLASPSPTPNSPAPTTFIAQEVEPNHGPKAAMPISLPATLHGSIFNPNASTEDEDWFRFDANQGETWILQVEASSIGSSLDSKIDIFHANGEPVLRTRLQATRESYFTFRGKSADGVDDFRLHNWEDMELNEYLYCNGEVVKLWLYPRGPDSGFKVYPGFGNRYNYFDTTATSHALGEPTWIVRPLEANQSPIPNGLPVFPIYFENDDDPWRRNGKDSRLTFTPPKTGSYLVRIRDARASNLESHGYQLHIRTPKPDFALSCNVQSLSIAPGASREWEVTAKREDGFQGPIQVHLEGLPPEWKSSAPLLIEAGQEKASGIITAPAQAAPSDDPISIQVVATSQLDGQTRRHEIETPLKLTVAKGNRVRFEVETPNRPYTMEIQPGGTASAKILAIRGDFQADIGFGNEDSGRNLPHGVIVGNIGLSGLLIPAGQSEQEFTLIASPWIQPQERLIHLRANIDGNPTTQPILLRVLSAQPNPQKP